MKVILKKDYEKLGKAGDALNVKDGFAMNYLIPNEIAMKATEGNLKVLEVIKKQREVKEKKEIADAEKLSAELEKLSLTIKVKAGEDDKIFGSVTSQHISEALAEKGYNVDKKHIEIEEPIKNLGIFTVNLRLNNNVKSFVKIWVVKE
ncbi:MAG: 50S ribosomal protein L9 [Ignavibacteria bacterium]